MGSLPLVTNPSPKGLVVSRRVAALGQDERLVHRDDPKSARRENPLQCVYLGSEKTSGLEQQIVRIVDADPQGVGVGAARQVRDNPLRSDNPGIGRDHRDQRVERFVALMIAVSRLEMKVLESSTYV